MLQPFLNLIYLQKELVSTRILNTLPSIDSFYLETISQSVKFLLTF